jgi:membrane protein DedA with SNARE-associated domain
MLDQFFNNAVWAAYAGAFIGPFVQEDAAILGAASAAMAPQLKAGGMFAAVLSGLIVSDTWKYWAGRLAHRSQRASRWVADPRVQTARERVVRRLGLTLLVARFVPGTRIPLYVACGVFKAPFLRFFIYVSASATIYVSLAFFLLSKVDAMLGARVRMAAPFVVLALVLVILGFGWLKSKRAAAANPPSAS